MRTGLMCATLALAGCGASVGIGIGEDGLIGTAEAPIVAASALDTVVTLAGPGIGIAEDPSRLQAGGQRHALVTGTFDWIARAAGQRGVAFTAPGGRFVSDQVLACDIGTVRVRSGFANSVVFAAGDTIDLDATDCRFGSVRFRGGLTIRVLDAAGFPGIAADWSARLSIDYRAWRVETIDAPLQARTFAGGAALEVRRPGSVDAELQFDSASLAIEPVIDGAARPGRRAESLSMRLLDSAVDDSLQVDLRLFDERLIGAGLPALSISSVGTIGLPGATPAFPVGQLRIDPGDDSVVLVDTLDPARIRLDIDRFVDGRIDASRTENWQSLGNRL